MRVPLHITWSGPIVRSGAFYLKPVRRYNIRYWLWWAWDVTDPTVTRYW